LHPGVEPHPILHARVRRDALLGIGEATEIGSLDDAVLDSRREWIVHEDVIEEPPVLILRRGGEIEDSAEAGVVRRLQAGVCVQDRLVPCQVYIVDVVRLVIEDQQVVVRGDALDERHFDRCDRLRLRLLPSERGDEIETGKWVITCLGCGVILDALLLGEIQLVDVRQVEHTARMDGCRGVTADDLHLELRPPFLRHAGIIFEDAPIAEVVREALVDDHIGGDQQEMRRHRGIGLEDFVEVGPDDRQAHHLRLAAASRHLRRIARIEVIGGCVVARCAIGQFHQVLHAASLADLVAEDEGLDGLTLGEVVAPGYTATKVLLGEPP